MDPENEPSAPPFEEIPGAPPLPDDPPLTPSAPPLFDVLDNIDSINDDGDLDGSQNRTENSLPLPTPLLSLHTQCMLPLSPHPDNDSGVSKDISYTPKAESVRTDSSPLTLDALPASVEEGTKNSFSEAELVYGPIAQDGTPPSYQP